MNVKKMEYKFDKFSGDAVQGLMLNPVFFGSWENASCPFKDRVVQDLYSILNAIINATHGTVLAFDEDRIILSVVAEISIGKDKARLETAYVADDGKDSARLLNALKHDDGYYVKCRGDLLSYIKGPKDLALDIKAEYAEIDDNYQSISTNQKEVYKCFNELFLDTLSVYQDYFFFIDYEDFDEDHNEKEGTEDET